MKRYCLALDLVNDEQLIQQYENWHKPENARPPITRSIRDAGILIMEIYRVGNRMFMIMETEEDFSFERKTQMDAVNAAVHDWEQLMWKYQQALPFAQPGEKWMIMDQIFQLK